VEKKLRRNVGIIKISVLISQKQPIEDDVAHFFGEDNQKKGRAKTVCVCFFPNFYSCFYHFSPASYSCEFP
jgi:hypothetical protein